VINARELGAVGERFLRRTLPGLEAQLANVADEIAYNNHDVDDGLRAGLISVEELAGVSLFEREHRAVIELYPTAPPRRQVHETIRRMINRIVSDVIRESAARIADAAPRSIDDVRAASTLLVGMSEPAHREHLQLKQFLRERVYRHYRVLRMTTKSARVLRELFEALMHDIALLPDEHREAARRAEAQGATAGRARVVADYVAGMTDRYAILEHRRLFNPDARS
jgi:dGTPase